VRNNFDLARNSTLFLYIYPLYEYFEAMIQGAFGYFVNSELSLFQEDSQIRKLVEVEYKNMRESLLIVYLLAIWEEHIDRNNEREWLDATQQVHFAAYRHIRHSYAHSFNGKRAQRFRAEFETIMNSADPIQSIRWDIENDKIELLKHHLARECKLFKDKILKNMLGRIANDVRP
jgi:hypothetical protein